jgi:hypothetical protein
MRHKEQLLWDCMRRNMPPVLWAQRVENVVADGMPDVYIGSSGKWVELKVPAKIPARPKTPLMGGDGLRISQKNWIIKTTFSRPEAAYILVRTIERELFLIPGKCAHVINTWPLSTFIAQAVASTWQEIAEVLR